MVTIYNGQHKTQPVGWLQGPNGEPVPIWGWDPANLALAGLQATGPIPKPEAFGMGGAIHAFYPDDPTGATFTQAAPSLMYDPSGDVINQGITAEYQTAAHAWEARAQIVHDFILAMMPHKP